MVEPDDIANLCVIFHSLRTRFLNRNDLIQNICNTLRIDSNSSSKSIINEAIKCRLICQKENEFFITKEGNNIAKAQKYIQTSLHKNAKDALIKNVYLNKEIEARCCAKFLMKWVPDQKSKTFIYKRNIPEEPDTLFWLQTLERVKLIVIDDDWAKISVKYIGIINKLFSEIRGLSENQNRNSGVLRSKIGALGEKLAIKYEKERLKRNGQHDLIPFVQRISEIDNSAGYDITSCKGHGSNPEDPIYIEVKSTIEKDVQFTWTHNEQIVGQKLGKSYWIYCFTSIDLGSSKGKGPYKIHDPVLNVTNVEYIIKQRDIWVKKK